MVWIDKRAAEGRSQQTNFCWTLSLTGHGDSAIRGLGCAERGIESSVELQGSWMLKELGVSLVLPPFLLATHGLEDKREGRAPPRLDISTQISSRLNIGHAWMLGYQCSTITPPPHDLSNGPKILGWRGYTNLGEMA